MSANKTGVASGRIKTIHNYTKGHERVFRDASCNFVDPSFSTHENGVVNFKHTGDGTSAT